ncbi:MAG: hypothetical protein FJW30_16740 [Acidobacteria bacterium]|nr:hypothetical protein [Acidobacteriota bacterium]
MAAFGIYLIHVALAFTFVYGWSHAAALRETARQTRELFGVDSGAGIYLNYLMTLVWGADCIWNWRARAWRVFVHALLAFLFFNASVVVWVLKSRT